MIKRIFLMAIMVVAIMALVAPNSYAVPTLQLTDLGTLVTVTIPDGSLSDSNPAVGVVTYIGAIGAGTWSVNVTTGITKPQIGNPVQAKMDLNSVDVSSKGGGTLNILFSEDNFGTSQTSFEAQIGGTIANLPGSSLTYNTFYDAGNGIFVETTPITSQGPFGPGAFSGTANAWVGNIAFPYSLTQDVTIVHTGNGTTSFDATLYNVPEPTALLLLGLGLLGLGLLKKKES